METPEQKAQALEQEARAALRSARAFEHVDVAHFMRVVGPQLLDVDNPRLRAVALANAVDEYKKQRPAEFRNVPNFRDPNVKTDAAMRRYKTEIRQNDHPAPVRVDFRDPNLNPKKALAAYKASLR